MGKVGAEINEFDLNFYKDKLNIVYLPVRYVEILRMQIIKMYVDSEDPIATGYKNWGDLEYTMEFVKSMYNNFKYRRVAIIKKASFIFYNIASKHPFTDGNKRSAIITCNSFLEYNGYSVGKLPYRDSHKFITEVAKGNKNEKDCQKFLRKHLCELKVSENSIKLIKGIIKKRD